MVIRGIVVGLVHADHDHRLVVFRRRGQNHLTGTRVEVRLQFRSVGEYARALEHDVDAERTPRQLCRILRRERLDRMTGDVQHAIAGIGSNFGATMHRVIVIEVRQRPRVGEIVDGNQFDVVASHFAERAQYATSDAAETVDGNLRGHDRFSCAASWRLAD